MGQDRAVELLKVAIARHRIAPAYLFVGAAGIGKSIAANCFIERLFCQNVLSSDKLKIQKRLRERHHPDVLWVEPTYQHQGQFLSAAEAEAAGLKRKAPPQIRIEQVREIAQFLSRFPLEAPRNMVVIEGAETMAEPAANALLKTLEEPGTATLILLATSEALLLTTIVSRCAKIPFYRLSLAGMSRVLKKHGYEAILQHPQILEMAQGSPGEAIAYFTQFQSIPETLLNQLQTPPNSLRNALELGKEIHKTLDAEGQLWLIDYLQHHYWHHGYNSTILAQLEKARQALRVYANPRLVWEVTLLNMFEILS